MSEPKNSSEPVLPEWAFVQKPKASGLIKVHPEDFVVKELLGFELEGSGEHSWLHIEKKGFNTLSVVNMLAEKFNVPVHSIGYSGLKDKHAITRQWFSVCSPKEISSLENLPAGIQVVEIKRHRSKLRRGVHQANQFKIVLKDLSKPKAIEQAIERIQRSGVPNYFGAQRFGRGGKNIDQARELFKGGRRPNRHQKGLYLSAARAFLFNCVLSTRVNEQSWATGLAGDIMMLAGSNSFFRCEEIDEILTERLLRHDIHPSAPLWGNGALGSANRVLELESAVEEQHVDLTSGLSQFGLRQQRRSMRLSVEALEFEWLSTQQLKLSFVLRKGAFATTVLRELITIEAQQSVL